MIQSVVVTAVSVFVGGAITWAVAAWYYRKAAKQLEQEAATLRRLNEAILAALEGAGLAKLSRDDKGNITGLQFNLGALAITLPNAQAAGTGTVSAPKATPRG